MELYLRANYAERVQERTTGELLAKEKRQLEARSEQLPQPYPRPYPYPYP